MIRHIVPRTIRKCGPKLINQKQVPSLQHCLQNITQVSRKRQKKTHDNHNNNLLLQ